MNKKIFLFVIPVLLVIIASFKTIHKPVINTSEKWAADIRYLVKQLPQKHINPYHYTSKESFERISSELLKRLPVLTESQVLVEVLKMVALIRDGHSTVSILGMHSEKSYPFHCLPIKTYVFEEGVFVIDAAEEYQNLIGKKIIGVNNTSFEEVRRAVLPLIPHDNKYTVLERLPNYLFVTEFLNGLGIIDGTGEAIIKVENFSGKTESVKIKATDISYLRPYSSGNMHGNTSPATEASVIAGKPLYLQNMTKPYWFTYLEKEKTLYIAYNSAVNDPQNPLKGFCDTLNKISQVYPIEKTVLDISHNSGGNQMTFKPFLEFIAGNNIINREGKLFAIIGRRVFSAGGYLAQRLQYTTNAIFVGEPTGTSVNGYGEHDVISLPNSGLDVLVSSAFYQNGFEQDNRQAVEPQLPVKVFARDFFVENNDPPMMAIMNYKPAAKIATPLYKKIIGKYLFSPLQILEITEQNDGMLLTMNEIDLAGRNVSFLNTTLFTDPVNAKVYKTNMENIQLSYDESGLNVFLHINGKKVEIPRIPTDYKTPANLIEEGKVDDAIKLFRTMLSEGTDYKPISGIYINRLGYTLLKKNDFNNAIKLLAFNVELYPKNGNVYDSLAEAYMLAGDKEAAIKNYKKALELDPHNDNARKNLEKLK